MKNKCLLWAASALFVIAGCTNDVIVDEKDVTTKGRKITLTASMPDEASTTRLGLEQETGTKNITVIQARCNARDRVIRNAGCGRHYHGG